MPRRTSPRSTRRALSIAALLFAVLTIPPAAGATAEPVERPSPAAAGEFRNPLNPGADPTVVHHDGDYYLSATQGDRISVWKSSSLATLPNAEPIEVWRDSEPSRSTELWAPAMHRFETADGPRWYIYYTAADSRLTDPKERDASHRLYVLESAGDDPAGPYEFKAQIADTGKYAIDGEPFLHDGKPYFAWSSPGRGFDGGPQQVYAAPMSNPWTVTGDPVALPGDGGCPEVREGPTPLYRDGTTYLTYSTCDTGKPDYQIWSIRLGKGADPMDAGAWEQLPGPLFSRNDDAGVWGPGHHFFFKSPDGTEDWIAYHGKNTSERTYTFRSTRAQRIGWNADGTPDLGRPLAAGATQRLPSGDPGAGSTAIDDKDTGTTGNRVSYKGDWTAGATCGAHCFYGDDHYTAQAGATATYHFTGSRIAVYGSLDTDHGYATFSVDGGPPSDPVSYHNPLRVGEQRTYLSPELGPGEHTLTVTVTGDRPEGATDSIVTIDRAEVYPAS
ncbi:GH43 family beta-xylosidase [Murinocardiopsis flavida]|uniref:GH43 family beta-xylosidase n=1 Tax=Murinocardiopsis flavida TaxID=645275 RepID=A0A2P8DFB6_9ACTN|nr:glycoside hydrolase family 43 protein [Murinocardiopsis flavida]PSK95902.1 GH43 family beta-xylosidase [Murinocardiopsis flavida]